jgi:DNA end-binding protein Ku
MARALWKGAIVFGLVNIPVDLYPGARSHTLDLDWIDKRDMAPVGYQRINKTTGKPVASEDVVKGYEYAKGRYVILSDEDFREANPKATQTVDIKAFVDAGAIPPQFHDTPYRLAPGKRGEKGYALLREALRATGKVGIAEVVIRTRQHLAAVMVQGDALVLELLRWNDELLDPQEFALPESGRKAGVNDKELDLAKRLVEDMSEPWKPEQYRDTYREDLEAQIERRVKAGNTEQVSEAPKARATGGAQVIDLMAALRQSLESKPARRKEAAGDAAREAEPAAANAASKSHARAAPKARSGSRAHSTARKRA